MSKMKKTKMVKAAPTPKDGGVPAAFHPSVPKGEMTAYDRGGYNISGGHKKK